jgi:isopentenyl-diphosphate delta-isomerase type 1
MDDEVLEVVDARGTVVGSAPRSELHGNPALLHRVVHVLVFNSRGQLLLQKRSQSKDVAPGLWDTSVGGHVVPGEDAAAAAQRELTEELGVPMADLTFLYCYTFSNDRESELVCTYQCEHEGPFAFNIAEIDEVRFWDIGDIEETLGKAVFSEHFEKEFSTYRALSPQTPRSSGP